MNPTARPRIGLIGVSGYAQIYLQLLREARERVHLVAAVVINPHEETAIVAELQQQGVAIYGDYQEMLARHAGQMDLCLIPTGIAWHARMTIAALRAGANVLVEKPLAGSLADGHAIRDAEKAANRFVAVGFQDIYAPENTWLKQQLCAGAIGTLTSVRMVGLWPRPTSYFTRNHWAGRLHADGAAVFDSPLNNAFAHFVNLSLFFAGSRPDVSATACVNEAELYRANAIETFDSGVVQATSAEGVQFWFGVSHTCRRTREPEIYIEGTAGHAEWLHERHCVIAPTNGPREVRPIGDTTLARRAMFDAVLARLRNPAFPVCDTAMAAMHTALIDEVHRVGPVRPVPPALIQWEKNTGPLWPGNVPVVRGLEEALDRALATRSTLRESGFAAPVLLPT